MPLSYTTGASYGWRARIGLLQPGQVSDTNPFEFYLMAPNGVQMVLTSLGLQGMSRESYESAIAALDSPVQRLIARNVDAMIQTGIPPLVTAGWGIEDELRQRVASLTTIPYITDAAASIAAMRALGVGRPAVVSGFDDELVDLMRVYFAHADIDLLEHERTRSSGDLPLEIVYRAARRAFQRSGSTADSIWITMASIPSVGVIQALEDDCGVPVVTSAQALMWAGLQVAGVQAQVRGFGRVFDAELPSSFANIAPQKITEGV